MTTLRLRVPDVADPNALLEAVEISHFEYCFNAENGHARLADMPYAEQLEIVLPARTVRLASAKVPRAKPAALQKLLPNLMEESVIGDSQECHMALLPGLLHQPHQKEHRLVAVVDRAWMRLARRIAQLRNAKRSLCVSEAQLTPSTPFAAFNAVTQTGFIRHPEGVLSFALASGVDASTDSSADTLNDAPNDTQNITTNHPEPPLEFTLLKTRLEAMALGEVNLALAGASPELCAAWSAALGIELSASDWSWQHAPSPYVLESLFQFEFAKNIRADNPARAWRIPALLALTTLALAIAGLNLHWWKLKREAQQLNVQMTADYQSLFPNLPLTDAPLLVAQRKLGTQKPDENYWLLNQALASAVEAGAPALRELDYRNGVLRATFADAAKANAALNQLRAANDLEVRVENAALVLARRKP